MDDSERERYSRHLALPGVDEGVYERVRSARVLVVGAGGLGSPVLLYLAAAGVGEIGVVDHDVVELGNLQRQVLYGTADIGRPKVDCAAERLTAIDPGVRVRPYRLRFDAGNAASLISEYDLVLSCADDTGVRYAANDECVRQHKVLVEAAVHHYAGQAITILGGQTACYRCLFPIEPEHGHAPYVTDKGILGPVAGMLGTIQAAEALKVITGVGEPLFDRLLTIDARTMTCDVVPVSRDPHCPVCAPAAP